MFSYGNDNDCLSRPNTILDQDTEIALPPYLAPPIEIGISPSETFIVYSTNTCMVKSIYDEDAFKIYH